MVDMSFPDLSVQARRVRDERPPHRNGILRRVAIAPFEFAIAFHAMWNGTTGLYGWSMSALATAGVLRGPQMIGVSLLFILAGLAMSSGILYRLREVEAFGLWALMTSAMLRLALVAFAVGWDPLLYGTNAYNLFYAAAAGLRLWVLMSGKALALIEESRAGDTGQGIISRVI